ncbi:hypothetical protein [Ascidiimonas sp. W6]|uniref:hypothetical protein n=1 Tax=Ascidiimonas meishanensis TaxID=3128903 RepID=UPI0030EE050E
MKLREYKRIILLLRQLESFLEKEIPAKFSVEIIKHYTNSELREMIYWLYRDVWSKNSLGFKNRPELIELINSDQSVLSWTIHQLEASMTATPSYSQVNVSRFFERTNNEIHYLASKPVEQWDEYDVSNYTNLLMKTGTTKKVYAIFDSDVLKEDVYAVTTKPSYFFDTFEEAETEINSIIAEGKFTKEELVIHSLWLLT